MMRSVGSSRAAALTLVAWSCATAVAACTVDQNDNPAYTGCTQNDECDSDQHCYHGYCVPNAQRSASGSDDDESLESPLTGEQGSRANDQDGQDAPADRDAAVSGAPAAANVPSGAADAAASEPASEPAPSDVPPAMTPDVPPDTPPVGEPQPEPDPDPPPPPEPEPCVPARKDTCTAVGGVAEDEDCDGHADEGCACMSGALQECFDAPSRALGVGACRAGTQSCADGAWGTCQGATLPRAETCDNSDEDCDGKTDEGFALNKDPANCGRCGQVCTGLLQACCDGVCKTLCLL